MFLGYIRGYTCCARNGDCYESVTLQAAVQYILLLYLGCDKSETSLIVVPQRGLGIPGWSTHRFCTYSYRMFKRKSHAFIQAHILSRHIADAVLCV